MKWLSTRNSSLVEQKLQHEKTWDDTATNFCMFIGARKRKEVYGTSLSHAHVTPI
jgi:hypothetical protein